MPKGGKKWAGSCFGRNRFGGRETSREKITRQRETEANETAEAVPKTHRTCFKGSWLTYIYRIGITGMTLENRFHFLNLWDEATDQAEEEKQGSGREQQAVGTGTSLWSSESSVRGECLSV